MANGNGNSNIDITAHSVTQNDYTRTPREGYSSLINFWFPVAPNQPGLPPYWSPLRDRVLRTTMMLESMWASAVNIGISKVANRSWKIEGTRVAYWQSLLDGVDNRQSWVNFVEKLAKDFLLTDNGCYFEIVRANNAAGSRILGIKYLPSWRMIPTGNLETPYIYRDRLGTWHYMRDYQLVRIVDSPENLSSWYNIDMGFCAASRAYQAIIKLSALEQYVYEKIAGKRPLSIYLVNAQLNEKQLQQAVDTQREMSNEKGYVQYMGAVMIPILDPTATPQVGEIKIAGLPDGFDAKEERLQGQIIYADAIGLDPTDLNPELAARGRALGSGSQAQVLDDKGKGKGIHSFPAKLTWAINDKILPARVMFSMYEHDLADDIRRAQVRKTNFEAMRVAVGNGMEPPIFTPTQAQNLLADMNEITPDYVSADLTAGETLQGGDKVAVVDAKPVKAPDDALMQTEQPAPAPALQKFAPQAVAQKERIYSQLVNAAEEWMTEKNADIAPLMTNDELVIAYLHAHPYALQAITKESTRDLQRIVDSERDNARALYRALTVTPKEIAQPVQHFNISLPEINLPQITLPQIILPEMNIAAPNVTLKEAASQFTIHLPASDAPTINVAAPNVTIENTVPVPQVDVQVAAPAVTVTNQVETPAVANTVNVPDPAAQVLKVRRDVHGRIAEVIRE